jgi:hypothetical protein
VFLAKVRLLAAIPLVMLFVVLPGAAVSASEAVVDEWQNATPAEIHQHLWEAKSRALVDERFANQSISQASVNNQTDYDVRFYDVSLRVNDTTEVIYGKVTFVIDAVVNNLSSVEVDFFSNMITDSIIGPSGAMTFGYVSSNLLQVNLDRAYDQGEQITFDFYYHGHPVEGGFQAFSFDFHGTSKVISSLSEPYFARTWWPCKDRMDDKPDSMKMAIEVAAGYYCGSNGTLDSVVNASVNSDVYYYSVGYPITTYLFSVAISEYTVWTQDYVYNGGADTMPVVHATYPDWYSYSVPRWGVTPSAIGIFSDVFGPYPFLDEKYGHSNFPWGGGMEHQTMTSMYGGSFGFSESVVVHELAHQWWGDMITCESWRDIWLNEGWASYAEALYYEALGGSASYHNYMDDMQYSSGGTIYLSDTSSVNAIFTSLVYDKGAWVLHMLRGIVGDSVFFAAVEAYYNSPYKYSHINSEQFEEIFEVAYGQQLDWFFDNWLHGTYRPNYYKYTWSEPDPNGGYKNYLIVQQTQVTAPQVFTMPFDIDIYQSPTPPQRERVFNDQRQQLFAFHTDNQADSFMIDPDSWVLKYQSNRSWELFVVSVESDVSDGMRFIPYLDTVEVRGGTGNFTVSITSGALPPGLSINNQGVISGTPGDTGTFTFTVYFDDNGVNWDDEGTYTVTILEAPGVPGDADGNGTVSLTDLTRLINFLFLGGSPVDRPDLADVNASCTLNLTDVTLLVNYLFVTFEPLQLGCAK